MPLFRRIPIKGFNNSRFAKEYEVLNLDLISNSFVDGDVVNRDSLRKKRIVKGGTRPIKILAGGVIDKKLTFEVDAVSNTAREKIVNAGGIIQDKDSGKVAADGE